MINLYKNNWKHTCGFIVSIRNGSFAEPEKCAGYTHLAEHMMFSGTEKLSRFELRDKHFKMFNKLEAITSREEVKIFGYFDLKDFDEVIEILRQMIYKWKCDKENFQDEKEDLLAEIKTYFSSYEYAMKKESYSLLPIKKSELLGDPAKMKKLTFEDLKKAKKYWEELLVKSNIGITFISGNLSKKQLAQAQNIFNSDIDKKNKKEKWGNSDIKMIESKKMVGFWFKSDLSTLNALLLDRIFYWRWNDNNDLLFDYEYSKVGDITAFYVFNEKEIKQKKEAYDFFTKPINKKEFEETKELLLKSFGQYLDVVDVVESLKWINGFRIDKYAELTSNDPQEAYKYFKKLKFDDFKSFVNDLQQKIIVERNKQSLQ